MRKTMLAVMLVILILPMVQAVKCAEIDMTSKVTSVHDGDTFTLVTGERVRLADLDAPELGEPGSYEARDYLDSLVYQQTVYLDVDDLYRTDTYGRLVCAVYVDYNSTHLLNVNKALIDGGMPRRGTMIMSSTMTRLCFMSPGPRSTSPRRTMPH